MKKLLIFFSFLTFSIQVFAQEMDSVKLNTYFKKLDSTGHMLSTAIWKEGKVVYENQTGYADVEKQLKPNTNTPYGIGSITKTFTAAMIMKAIEEGKIKHKTLLSDFFPQFENANQITIDQLLSHQSGLYNFTNDSLYSSYYTQPISRKKMLEIIQKYPSVFSPGEKNEYSNTNYVLLSYILEKIYKKPYKDILNEKIIRPLGLKHTYFRGDGKRENEAFSYIWEGNKWQKMPQTDPSVPMGAGAIVSTPTDLMLFADALFNGKIITPKSLSNMTEGNSVYRKGLFLMPFGIKKGFGHTGGIDGFTSVFVYFPDDRIGAAITSNGSNANNNDILIILLKAAFQMPFQIPSFKQINVPLEKLKTYKGVYGSDTFPLDIIIRLEGGILKAQATGQSEFPLTAKSENIFVFTPAGIRIEFIPEKKQLILKQAGQKFILTKK